MSPPLLPAVWSAIKPVYEALTAHPRMRGENGMIPAFEAGGMGSSPHARGKPWRGDVQAVTTGLIPACAGKTP